MRFVADAMLGRLAKWLRFLGYDVLYHPDIRDAELIRIAREQDRCILTRNTRLARRKGIPRCLLIFSNDPPGQLREVKKSSLLTGADLVGRCVACNGSLVAVGSKQEVRDLVPEHIFLSRTVFHRCSDCDRIYWQGTHQKRFRDQLKEMLQENGD